MERESSDDSDALAETALRSRVKAALFDGKRLETLGRFEIVERLGAGGMGVVYRARDPSLDRDVAIKVLSSFSGLGTTGRARLQREARAMAKLSHPNVAHVYEVAGEGDEVYIAMEYIDGPSLGAWAGEHRDDPDAVLAMYRAAGEGLRAAHEAGFVHRDFKPDNVLVGSDDRPRVLDFGLATALADGKQELGSTRPPDVEDLEKSLTATGAIMGTPAYMAPEQFLGQATDQRTDQFAFCIALWEALTGARPFEAKTFADLSDAVVRGRIADGPVDGLPPDVEKALRRGLAVDPEERFPNMRALLAALGRDDARPASARGSLVLVGAGLALAAFSLYYAGADPTPESAAVEAPEADPEDAKESKDQPPEPLSLEILTNTTGYGVSEGQIHPDGDRYLYRADGAYWIARFDGGVPKKLPLPPGELQSVAFHGPDQYVALQDGKTPVAIVAGKPPRPLPFRVPQGTVFVALSPSADSMLFATNDGVWLGRQNSDPVRIVKTGSAASMEWSPDGSRFAVLVESIDGAEVRMWLFTAAGKRVADEVVPPTAGLAWLGPKRIVIGAEDRDDGLGLQCYRATEKGLRAGEFVPVTGLKSLRYAIHGSSKGRLMFELETSTRRDVAIVPFADPSQRREVAPGMQARNWAPEWLDDRRVALMSNRFGSGMLFIYDTETGRTSDPQALPGHVPRDCSAFGDGRLLCRVASEADEALSLATFDVDEGWKSLPADDWTKAITTAACDRQGHCFATADLDHGFEVGSVDPETGATETLHRCPGELTCRFHWTVTPDGASMLTNDATQVRLAWLDFESGATRFAEIPESEGFIVQSATNASGRTLVTQMALGPETEDYKTYRIVELIDGQPRILVDHNHEWMIEPRISPDGRRFAFTFLSFHFEVATADASQLCR